MVELNGNLIAVSPLLYDKRPQSFVVVFAGGEHVADKSTVTSARFRIAFVTVIARRKLAFIGSALNRYIAVRDIGSAEQAPRAVTGTERHDIIKRKSGGRNRMTSGKANIADNTARIRAVRIANRTRRFHDNVRPDIQRKVCSFADKAAACVFTGNGELREVNAVIHGNGCTAFAFADQPTGVFPIGGRLDSGRALVFFRKALELANGKGATFGNRIRKQADIVRRRLGIYCERLIVHGSVRRLKRQRARNVAKQRRG